MTLTPLHGKSYFNLIYLSPGLSVSYFLIYSDISRLVCITVLIFYSHCSRDKKFLIMLLPATPSFTAGRYSRWICVLDFRICVFSWSWPGIFHVLGKCVSLLYKTVALFAFEEDSWGKTILNLVMAPNWWFYSPLWKRFKVGCCNGFEIKDSHLTAAVISFITYYC